MLGVISPETTSDTTKANQNSRLTLCRMVHSSPHLSAVSSVRQKKNHVLFLFKVVRNTEMCSWHHYKHTRHKDLGLRLNPSAQYEMIQYVKLKKPGFQLYMQDKQLQEVLVSIVKCNTTPLRAESTSLWQTQHYYLHKGTSYQPAVCTGFIINQSGIIF